MYAQGRYVEDLDLDLASKYYFQTQSNIKEDIHYRTIYTMLFYLEVLSSLLYAFLCLTIYTWIFPAFDKSKQGLKETISPKLIKFTTLDKLKHPHYVAKGITAAIAVIPLVGFHLIAVTELYRYRQKVFQEKDALGPSSVALIFTSSVTVVYLIIFYIVYKRQKFSLKNYIMHCLTSLSIAYLGHFIPFISLAFITDPLKTVLIVTGEMLVVICVYGIVLVLVYSVQYKSLNVLLDALGWLLSAVILIAALITVLTLFSIGNFNGFDDIQELLFPLIGTVGTILIGFYLKPSSKMEEDSEAESSADKEQEMYTQEDDTTVV